MFNLALPIFAIIITLITLCRKNSNYEHIKSDKNVVSESNLYKSSTMA